MMLTEHFDLREFVPPEIHSIYGDNSIWFLDREMVGLAEQLRIDLNAPITINNWHTGGKYKNSGYRSPDCPEGKELSDHKRMIALDIKVRGMTAEQVRQHLRDNYFMYDDVLTTIEKDTPTWVHISKRWTGLETLLEISYYS